ncbi:MAG: rhodanese-like domain-containing protein [Flavobacteriaceae bacterium]|nr:rhodanese-like domain-containing protein [Flavobacteriaceae bacterium]
MKRVVFMCFLTFFGMINSSDAQEKTTAVLDADSIEIKVHLIAPQLFNKGMGGHVLVDVRTPQEFKYGHIENAVNINFYAKKWMDKFSDFDTSQPIYIYCKSDNRSGHVALQLIEAGFIHVYELEHGITQWKKEGLPLVKE